MGFNDELPNAPDEGVLEPNPSPRGVSIYSQMSGFRTVVTPESGGDGITNKDCEAIQLLHICGGGQTNVRTGKGVLRLSNYACMSADALQARHVYFVATPHSATPVFFTSEVVVQQGEIIITVHGWRLDGFPSGRVAFDWHCCVELNRGASVD